MASKDQVTYRGYDGLAMAIIDITFDDLVQAYKDMFSMLCPYHSKNTFKRWMNSPYKKSRLIRAQEMRDDCLKFLLSEDYEYYRLNLDIDGKDIVKSARHKALKWINDRDSKSINQSRKYVKKQTKKAIARHKRKEKKHNG